MGLFDKFKKKTEEAKTEVTETKTAAAAAANEALKKAEELKKKRAEAAAAEEAKLKAEAEKAAAEAKKVEDLAKEVIRGKWGNGQERKDKLAAAGYDYAKIQAKVNEILGGTAPVTGGKTVEELAKEVIRGKWGNGQERKDRLAAAGYDYATIQAKVNELLK